MRRVSALVALCASSVEAFPWMRDLPGINLAPLEAEAQRMALRKRQLVDKGGPEFCPISPGISGAAPFNPLFPYTGAVGGLPGTGRGGVQVPAPGDTAHYFTEPGPLDIRGPCPGMNTAANHNVSPFIDDCHHADLTNISSSSLMTASPTSPSSSTPNKTSSTSTTP